ncbi:MAG: hypothetical protein PHF74_05805 [Dehalococcoidales bacterium]|nr:hypothetical protein [Dehalococcoidales bacterium]
MESIVKLGEVQLEITGDVKTTEDLKVLLRWGWGAETTNKMAIKPSEDLKIGDGIKVTIEKVVIVPDPVEEKVEDTAAETEAEQEAVAESESTGETVEKTEPVAECECACSCERAGETEKTEESIAANDTKTV